LLVGTVRTSTGATAFAELATVIVSDAVEVLALGRKPAFRPSEEKQT
jgi:hypothetical protein